MRIYVKDGKHTKFEINVYGTMPGFANLEEAKQKLAGTMSGECKVKWSLVSIRKLVYLTFFKSNLQNKSLYSNQVVSYLGTVS